jgi:hypothetical protein
MALQDHSSCSWRLVGQQEIIEIQTILEDKGTAYLLQHFRVG